VKYFKAEKGYGFIRPDEGSSDVFVHASDVERAGMSTLAEGMRLGFELETDPRKGRTKAGWLRLL
jgi:CspA family cold shock protein